MGRRQTDGDVTLKSQGWKRTQIDRGFRARASDGAPSAGAIGGGAACPYLRLKDLSAEVGGDIATGVAQLLGGDHAHQVARQDRQLIGLGQLFAGAGRR